MWHISGKGNSIERGILIRSSVYFLVKTNPFLATILGLCGRGYNLLVWNTGPEQFYSEPSHWNKTGTFQRLAANHSLLHKTRKGSFCPPKPNSGNH